MLTLRSYRKLQGGAFAWTDPDVAGSRLDPQQADFARRAAELWTQIAGLREIAGGQESGDTDTRNLAVALQEVRTGSRSCRSRRKLLATNGNCFFLPLPACRCPSNRMWHLIHASPPGSCYRMFLRFVVLPASCPVLWPGCTRD